VGIAAVRGREDTPPDTPSEYFLQLTPSSRLAAMNLQLTRTSPAITDRQRQIVALIAAGCSNEEVGRHLGISARTAKAHSDTLRQKLGVERRRQIPGAYYRLTGKDPFIRALSDPLLLGG